MSSDMQPATETDYGQLSQRLAVCDLTPSAAEAHGILCGLICAGEPRPEERWLAELLAGADAEDLLARELRTSLAHLAARTREEIDGPGLGFAPLLPDESRSLGERATGLYDWSRGFLFGLGLAGVDADALSAQAREALDDFAAITRMDLAALDEDEDNEEALMELQEFIWVAAMLIHEERGRREEGH